jgi:negative regulator of flagellin synthesis FlgM
MKVKDTSEVRRADASRPHETKKSEKATASAADKVSTEAKAQVEAAATAARHSLGSNRAVRLEAIEAAIRQGTFKPDPARIAQRILDEAEVTAMLQTMLGR